MPIEQWSPTVRLVRLFDDPAFTDELLALEQRQAQDAHDVVLDFASVTFVSSSNLAKLLQIRKQCVQADRRLVLCALGTQVWGAFLATGLDALFTFADAMPLALASLQIDPR